MAQAHSDAIRHFDKSESLRVTRYSNELGGTEVARGDRPMSNAMDIPMNTAELVKLETCYGRIMNIIELIKNSAAIATASKGEKYSDLRNREL
ncbi:hypothetical protein B0T25DRAFT_568996 [Lasiosphaeria hispida]|uniref:Uncharacterized protein n=1 Tax=Lasiosphaeria hispida TaxID=260671 RepID=A0AAJ0HJE3_9PEZI|nr:hypothetical protein B0T25DRAFT_568996 [Lasiosphaeria hispida]